MKMIKIILPIITFIFIIYSISYYWEKANTRNQKKIAASVGTILVVMLFITIYLLIDYLFYEYIFYKKYYEKKLI